MTLNPETELKPEFAKSGGAQRMQVQESGELKQFTTDLAFISGLEGNYEIICLASGPCHYLEVLSHLFPDKLFHLYNHNPRRVKFGPNLVYAGEFLDEDDVKDWEDRLAADPELRVALISDVRTIRIPGEEEVNSTMAYQKYILERIKPDFWSITFRMPFSMAKSGAAAYEYLDGKLVIPPFSKALSPELKLNGRRTHLLFDSPLKMYNVKEITNAMYGHNTIIRVHKNLFTNIFTWEPSSADNYISESSFDHGYDSTYFLFAILWYTARKEAITRPHGEKKVIAFAKRLMACIV